MTRIYPRATLKKILKAHLPENQFSNNVDIMLYLDYIHFLQSLAEEANLEANSKKAKIIRKEHIDSVLENTLKRFDG
ncbi:4835_t:CDS:2 [Ambispora leptoticha]|uniref:4835_t:CDS:1 n=1 Tax=Ambispora leptoticha TaxID=144679 RepID=A0A9N8WFR2_9GLOM|nr:4835_t:CDS:2 [Ambispora leptoticha]